MLANIIYNINDFSFYIMDFLGTKKVGPKAGSALYRTVERKRTKLPLLALL